MTIRRVVFGLLVLAAASSSVAAQGHNRLMAAARYESYSFKLGGVELGSLSELTVPVGFDASLGRLLTVAVSSGYASITASSSGEPDETVSGVLDTEIRLGVNLIPGTLIFVLTGVIPTGIKTLDQDEAAVVGPLAIDVIGFSAPSIGSGGAVGGGLVGAVPIGRWALGLGATYKYGLSYEPLAGSAAELRVGPELRTRLGLEGPLGRRTYLRLAGIYAARGKDTFQDNTQNGVGNRLIGYIALSQVFGNSQLVVYSFDVYRDGPRVEPTAIGAALLPKGNLLAGGFRFDLRLGRSTTITPRAEYRSSASAADTTDTSLRNVGWAVRFGVDLGQDLSPRFRAVFQVDGFTGAARDDQTMPYVDIDGFRAGVFLTVRP